MNMGKLHPDLYVFSIRETKDYLNCASNSCQRQQSGHSAPSLWIGTYINLLNTIMDAWQRGVVMSCMRQCKYTSMGGAHLPDTKWEITHALPTDYPVPAVSWDFWFFGWKNRWAVAANESRNSCWCAFASQTDRIQHAIESRSINNLSANVFLVNNDWNLGDTINRSSSKRENSWRTCMCRESRSLCLVSSASCP